MGSLAAVEKKIIACRRCTRLVHHCTDIAKKRKREFQQFEYWGKPVPGFGDPKARLWIIGLAPAAHGANRTGRMFTGDSSGKWLYRALHLAGFANQPTSENRQDGLTLKNAFVSSAGRCAPPDNKPTLDELTNCSRFLDEELRALENVTTFLALGGIAFEATLKLLARNGMEIPKPKPKFGHDRLYQVGKYQILCSYHPSRQNTQTGRLTQEMWNAIFHRARQLTYGVIIW